MNRSRSADWVLKPRVMQAIVVGLIFGMLEVSTRTNLLNPTLLVPPSQMVTALVVGVTSGDLFMHFTVTLQEIAISYLVAATAGVMSGVFLWKFDVWGESLAPLLLAVYAVPIFGFYPILIVWFGFGILPVVLMATVLGIIPIVVQTRDAFRELDAVYHKIAHSLQLGIAERMWRIYLPAAAPVMFDGLRLGLILCLLTTITAEFLLGRAGLGFLVRHHYQFYNTKEMYAAILFIVLIAAGLHVLLDELQVRFFGGVE